MKLLAIACVVTGAACGGSGMPPAPPSGAPDDAAATTPLATSSPASSSIPAASADIAAEDAGSKPAAVVEQKDECTPVGVDFERRARPKLKECYAEGKKKNPSLEGTVKIKVTVDVKGKIKTVKVIEKTLPDPVAACMLGVIKKTPFPEVDKCWDASLTIPVTFPTPR